MNAPPRWMPHPNRTYHLKAPEGRHEVLRGDAVAAALAEAPEGTLVWMQDAASWVDARSTLLRGRWRRAEAVGGAPTMWVSERDYAARLHATWTLTRLEPLDEQVRDVEPLGTWLPGEPNYAREVEASEADIARWIATLDAPDPADRCAAANLLTVALWEASEFHGRDEHVGPLIARLVPLLEDPDRDVVEASARLLQAEVADPGCADDYYDRLWKVRKNAFIASGGPAAWGRALEAGPMDRAFAWLTGLVCIMNMEAGAFPEIPPRLMEAVQSNVPEVQISSLRAVRYFSKPALDSEAGNQLRAMLARCASSNIGAMRVQAGRTSLWLWDEAAVAPDWVLGGAIEALAHVVDNQVTLHSGWSSFDWEISNMELELGSPWRATKGHLYAQTKVVEVCVRGVEEGMYGFVLSEILAMPEVVQEFLKIGGPPRLCKLAEGYDTGFVVACRVIGGGLSHPSVPGGERGQEKFAEHLAGAFCWGRVAAHTAELHQTPASAGYPDHEAEEALLAICNVAACAADAFALQPDVHSCIQAVGRWLHPRVGAESFIGNMRIAAQTLANFACAPALKPAVRMFLPRLKQLTQHADREVRKIALQAVENCS